MNRRRFSRQMLILGTGLPAGLAAGQSMINIQEPESKEFYEEPSKKLPLRHFDVVVAGGGTAGLFAAIASGRQGARTMLIESKGYCGGIAVEGGTAIHSFYNLYTAFPGCAKRKVIRGIPAEFMDRLTEMGGCTGYPEMETGRGYDSICTAIDTEQYKLLAFNMLKEANVFVAVNTLLAGAIVSDGCIQGVITESRSGREAIMAKSFIDCTGYGDLCAHAHAEFTVPNDYDSCNSFSLANASIDDYYKFLESHSAIGQICRGPRSGEENKLVRVGAEELNIPEFSEKAKKIGMSMITTTVRDNYLMYVKCNYKIPGSVVNRDDVAAAEIEIRQRMAQGSELLRQYVPGFEKAFIARTSPSLCIRRGRLISCDYDITHEDVIDGRHFDDDVFVYGFHDFAPRFQIKDGGTYGIPYRALCVRGVENLYAAGMMITSDHRAHMSTRNTVSCMAQGQAVGTAAALCAAESCGTRELSYTPLREALEKDGVYFER
ncbi:MAG: FAD-dependent oxidoreductase [Calditrichaeota bacterium]|nr:MAG: FAD-dependent oxidoreductase [Calditrichota bacterium]